MMKRLLVVAVLLSCCAVWSDQASAADVSVSTLNGWLCRVLSSRSPGDELGSFPGAPGGSVTTEHGRTPVRTLRSGRTYGGNQIYRWRYSKDGFSLRYDYQENKRGEKYGFTLKIDGPSSGTSLILKSNDEARRWLSSLATIRRGREDGDDEICARGSYDSDSEDYDFKACADVEMQEIQLDWMDAEDFPLSQICR